MNKNIWIRLFAPQGWSAMLLLLLVIGGLWLFDSAPALKPMKDLLSSEALSIKIGKYYFSVYQIIKTILIVAIFLWLTNIIAKFIEKYINGIKRIKTDNKAFLIRMMQYVVYFIALIIGLNLLGLDLTNLAIFGGAIGIGVGFGLQRITSNFISGLILFMEKSVRHGDMIELSDGTFGYVRKIKARYSLIETFQGKETIVPNEDLIIGRVINWTHSNNKARQEVDIGVSYNADIDKVQKLILQAVKGTANCATDPAPKCFLWEFADSAVIFRLYFWVEDVNKAWYDVKSDVLFNIWHQFKKHNIEIPYPQMDVHLKGKPSAVAKKNGGKSKKP